MVSTTLVCVALSSKRFDVSLKNGVRLSVVAVFSAGYDRFWTPEGKMIGATQRAARPSKASGGIGVVHVGVEVTARSGDAPSASLQVGSEPMTVPSVVQPLGAPGGRKRTWKFVFDELPPPFGVAPIRVGVATGPWQTVGTASVGNGRPVRHGVGFLRVVRPWVSPLSSRPLVVADTVIPQGDPTHVFRVRMVDRKGRELARETVGSPAGNQDEWVFRGKYEDASRVELQTRERIWVSFPNLHFHPVKP
jgi:hypothetical protein